MDISRAIDEVLEVYMCNYFMTAIYTLRWKGELARLIAKHLEFGWGKIQSIIGMVMSTIATICIG